MFKRNKIGGPDHIKKLADAKSHKNKRKNTYPTGRKVMQNVL